MESMRKIKNPLIGYIVSLVIVQVMLEKWKEEERKK